MPDRLFDEPRLAAVYDPLDPDRSDLEVYDALVDELGARSVVDVGCGTGTFACLLAGRGLEVTGVDPAAAMLAVARRKAHAERVRWVHGEAADLPPLAVDLATMTGNVAQVFVDDQAWADTLAAAGRALRPGDGSSSRAAVPNGRPGSTGPRTARTSSRRSPAPAWSRPGTRSRT